jgi:hypothetical protein
MKKHKKKSKTKKRRSRKHTYDCFWSNPSIIYIIAYKQDTYKKKKQKTESSNKIRAQFNG